MPSSEALTNTFRLITSQSGNSLQLNLWMRRYRTRRQLKAVLHSDPERLLKDLGLHAAAVKAECKKWFWQA